MKKLKLKSILNEVTQNDLKQVEKFAEKELDPVDIDFTKHFFDRVLDPRNIKMITFDELILFFKGLAKYKNKFFDFIDKYTEFVVTNNKFKLNIPFVKVANKLIAKTIMRKGNFMTSNPKMQFERNGEKYQTFYEYILKEAKIPKKKWLNVEPEKFSDDLINLVQTAYKNTPQGSFVNTKSDLIGSDWHSIDFDDEPDVDATIFYRKPRGNENWKGNKIQGIGHDGSRESINLVLNRLKKLLTIKGNWVEASDALEHILYKAGVKYVDDESYAQRVFPNTNLKFIGDRGKYTRNVGGKKIKETIFGTPIIKK